MSARNTATNIDRDHTEHRIRAYLATMKPMRGCNFDPVIQEQMDRGQSLMESLALDAAGGNEPDIKLSPTDCADILTYMSSSCPLDPRGWWEDKERISHICGYVAVLDAMSDSLRALRRRR